YQPDTGYDFAVARVEGYGLSVGGTAGNDAISIDAGTQAGTLKVTVNGVVTDNVTVNGQVFVAGLGGDDTISVSAALAGGLILDGQGGSDSYTVNFGHLAGTVQVIDDGAVGTDTVTVRGTPADDDIFKDAARVTITSPVQETVLSSGVEKRVIRGGGG